MILNDNNYVISHMKPTNVKVLQVWHACGAVKNLVIKSKDNILYVIMIMFYVMLNIEGTIFTSFWGKYKSSVSDWNAKN